MRDIEFRGKRSNGEWVYGYLVVANGKYYILPDAADFSYGDNGNRIRIGCFVEVDPNTVGQYTGLKDKNGVKIYENDIISFNFDEINRIGIIKYSLGTFNVSFPKKFSYGSSSVNNYDGEIIGNIHDNPELL